MCIFPITLNRETYLFVVLSLFVLVVCTPFVAQCCMGTVSTRYCAGHSLPMLARNNCETKTPSCFKHKPFSPCVVPQVWGCVHSGTHLKTQRTSEWQCVCMLHVHSCVFLGRGFAFESVLHVNFALNVPFFTIVWLRKRSHFCLH